MERWRAAQSSHKFVKGKVEKKKTVHGGFLWEILVMATTTSTFIKILKRAIILEAFWNGKIGICLMASMALLAKCLKAVQFMSRLALLPVRTEMNFQMNFNKWLEILVGASQDSQDQITINFLSLLYQVKCHLLINEPSLSKNEQNDEDTPLNWEGVTETQTDILLHFSYLKSLEPHAAFAACVPRALLKFFSVS